MTKNQKTLQTTFYHLLFYPKSFTTFNIVTLLSILITLLQNNPYLLQMWLNNQIRSFRLFNQHSCRQQIFPKVDKAKQVTLQLCLWRCLAVEK